MTFLFVFKTSLVFQNTGAYDLHRLVNVSPQNVHISTLNLISLTTCDSIFHTISSGTIANQFKTFGITDDYETQRLLIDHEHVEASGYNDSVILNDTTKLFIHRYQPILLEMERSPMTILDALT